MLHRKIEKVIENYLQDGNAKILCIDGARQIGKSYIIRNVCQRYYDNYIELNMADDYNGQRQYQNVRTVDDFYLQTSISFGESMNSYEDTVIFIDEIQIYPQLLTLLKPLHKDRKFKIICSGSELGITMKKTALIPMGSIDEIKMYPMDFEEFLWANSVGSLAIDHMHKCFVERKSLEESFHNKILSLFKTYLFVGGLPEAVDEYVRTKNIARIKKIQDDTNRYYGEDASKYDLEHKLRIKRIYDMVPSNIENKVKRLQYKQIENKEDARYQRYEDEFDFLVSSGIALETKAISEPKFPLVQSSTKNSIKLYMNDVGILTNLLYKNNINAIIEDKTGVNLGAVYETVVAQELKCHGHQLFYFDKKKLGEVDFLIDNFNELNVVPIEVKSGTNEKNYRALPKLLSDKNYRMEYGYVLSNKGEVKVEDSIVFMPIYNIMFF